MQGPRCWSSRPWFSLLQGEKVPVAWRSFHVGEAGCRRRGWQSPGWYPYEVGKGCLEASPLSPVPLRQGQRAVLASGARTPSRLLPLPSEKEPRGTGEPRSTLRPPIWPTDGPSVRESGGPKAVAPGSCQDRRCLVPSGPRRGEALARPGSGAGTSLQRRQARLAATSRRPCCEGAAFAVVPGEGEHGQVGARELPVPGTSPRGGQSRPAAPRPAPAPRAAPRSAAAPWQAGLFPQRPVSPSPCAQAPECCPYCWAGARPALPPSLSPTGGALTSIFSTSSRADLKPGRYLPCSQALHSVQMEARNLSFEASSWQSGGDREGG